MTRPKTVCPFAPRIIGLALMIGLLLLPASAKADRLVITDMAERTIRLDGPAKRLVTTFKPATLCLFCLGLQNRLVGIDTDSRRDPLHQAVFPGVTEIPAVGTKSAGLNLETIVSLKPDLVILYAQKDGRQLADRLDALGIRSLIILPETFDSIKQTLELIARAAGSAPDVIPATGLMDEVLTLVERRLSDQAIEKKKRAYFASPRGLFSTATGHMLQDEILTRAGLINVSHDLRGYFQDISPEQLIRWNPDIIVLSRGLDVNLVRRLDTPVFQAVTAVTAGAVYRFPSSLSPWDFPSPLSALSTLWLAQKAYPDRFDPDQTRAVIEQFHQRLFGRSLSEMSGELGDIVFKIK
jgi:iron complex transport system substrate-binding protein